MDPTTIKPEQPPWASDIEKARNSSGMSFRTASAAAGISEALWRQIEAGYRSLGDGWYKPVSGAPDKLASMAKAVGVTPDQLRAGGRADAADELERATSRDAAVAAGQGSAELDDLAEFVGRLQWSEGIKRIFIAAARAVDSELQAERARHGDNEEDSEFKEAI